MLVQVGFGKKLGKFSIGHLVANIATHLYSQIVQTMTKIPKELHLRLRPVTSQHFTMKVVLQIIAFLAFSQGRFLSPGIIHNWDNSLVGLDFLAFGHNHLEFQPRV